MDPSAPAHASSIAADWQDEIEELDVALYGAIAVTPTPALDSYFRGLSRAADRAKLWIGCAAVLAAAGGRRGRRAAVNGLMGIAGTSAVVNLVVKPVSRRRRPDRRSHDVPAARHVAMPGSTSFPSGHAASAFAFATGVGIELPQAGLPVTAVAALVAYSRVHTGVHYPGDVIAGSIIGGGLAPAIVAAVDRRRSRPVAGD